jgi:hypothetical protein
MCVQVLAQISEVLALTPPQQERIDTDYAMTTAKA